MLEREREQEYSYFVDFTARGRIAASFRAVAKNDSEQ
jgi:hypothetical protein